MEYRARYLGAGISTYATLDQTGDVAIGAWNYHENVMVRCPVCDTLHVVPTFDSTGSYSVRWNWYPQTVTLAPSVRVSGHRGVCHWTLTNGIFTIHGDSTAKRE